MTIKARVYLLLAVFLLVCSSLLGQEPGQSSVGDEPDRTFNSLKKSLLIPGWGQLAEKRYLEGVAFLTAELFCLYEIFSYNRKGNRYYKKYKEAATVDDAVAFRELTEKYDKRRNIYMLAAAGVWALNLLDIYLIVKSKQNKQIKVKLESGADKKLAFTISFSF